MVASSVVGEIIVTDWTTMPPSSLTIPVSLGMKLAPVSNTFNVAPWIAAVGLREIRFGIEVCTEVRDSSFKGARRSKANMRPALFQTNVYPLPGL